ncbi:unnamed protein product [Effrenium voratum]|uniref:Enoyl reductase (ER) domain-containing protein n=1 Tax=Effrenium voratum TaxID=2562239 RepID=A0AA36N333_9DINO|nr:unnamed protein product [Effrenium voratum]CAJ1413799.1 unnamed protein product [Effrenium voratum]
MPFRCSVRVGLWRACGAGALAALWRLASPTFPGVARALVVRRSSCKSYAALGPGGPLVPHQLQRRPVGERDVAIRIKYAGICHSDIHQVRQEWAEAMFPMVPGHEVGGVVQAVGAAVTKFRVGDRVGVGNLLDSCRQCRQCLAGQENYCRTGPVYAYNDRFKYPHCAEFGDEAGGGRTYGGYSQAVVVDEAFVCRVPEALDLAGATPLLCAGITVYSPLKFYGLRKKQRLGVAGLGGLGAMAVLIGKAMGADVTVLSRSEAKRHEALQELKADSFAIFPEAKEAGPVGVGDFDMIVDTIAGDHELQPYIRALAPDGKLVVLGIPPKLLSFHAFELIAGRKSLAGSISGGIKETQEMLEFCAQHRITCPHELIGASQINEAFDRVVRSDVKYRFVIDTGTM